MRNVKNTMIDTLLSVVAPHLCSGCGKIGSNLCDHCKDNIVSRPFLQCVMCEESVKNGVCVKHGLSYDKIWIVGVRTGVLQRLIGGLKFQNMKAGARSLADLLDSRLPVLPKNTVIIPVPTSSVHIRERGYDHAVLIAQHLGYMRRLEVDTRLVQRQDIKTQHTASRKDRMLQVQTAFQVDGSVDLSVPYLIIDDVVTTGSTIEQMGFLLKQAGAGRVWIGALARQPLD